MDYQIYSEKTKQRLMNAAQACFRRMGYDSARVEDICAEAGVSKGAFYHHFPNKQVMFATLLDQWMGVVDEAFYQVRSGTERAPDALRAMARAARRLFANARENMPLVLAFWLHATRDPVIWEMAVEPYHRYHEYIASIIRQGIHEGSIRAVNADTAAQSIVGLAVGMLAQGMVGAGEQDWAHATVDAMELVINGLAA